MTNKGSERIYIEYGLDFDNNKFGLSRSVEIEHADGTEERKRGSISIKNTSVYFRFWIFKRVLVISRDGFEIVHKKRYNFKIVLGFAGERT